ncbi:transposable element Tcb2 transposase [Trichonephila clavipes]|nr:transposable element Tcb2 transposase [Trichonephila clavipes]
MRQAFWPIFLHKLSTDEYPQHGFCPIGEDSWCGFKKAEASGKSYKHKNSLPVAVVEAMRPIFRDLSHPDLLKNVCMEKHKTRMKVFMSFGHVFPKQHLYRLKHFPLVFMMLFVPLMMWYWVRTRDKASNDPIPIPLGYRGHRWIVRSVPLEILETIGHEKVPMRGKPGLERPGRPRGERIVQQALVDPTVTRSTIRADVGVAILPQTIFRHLVEANLKSKRPFCALPLTPEHSQLRLQWCQARSMWNVTDWQKDVFNGESRFVLGTDVNRVRVWRHPVVMRGTLTGQRYVNDILRPHVGPFLNGLPGAMFQQDNARPHTARVAQDFLRHFQTLPLPARSSDLFSVEHVWDQLKRQMPSCHSVHDLKLAVQDL